MKCRWWVADMGLDLRSLRQAMENRPFSKERGFGFIIDDDSGNGISGECVTEVVEHLQSVDPYGDLEKTSVRTYERTKYSLRVIAGNELLLRVDSPPRSIVRFVDATEMVTGRRFYLSPLKLPYDDLGPLLMGAFGMHLKAVKMGAVTFSRNVVGKAYLAAIEGSRLSDFAVLTDTKYRIDAFQGYIPGIPAGTQVATTATNGLSAHGMLEIKVRDAVEEWLFKRARR